MEYKMHNLELIAPANQKSLFEEIVTKKIKQLNKIVKNYPKNLFLDVYIKKEGSINCIVTACLNLRGKAITIEEKGTQPDILVNNALDRLITQVKKQLELERKEFLYKRKIRLYRQAENSLSELNEKAKAEDQNGFTKTVTGILPDIQNYIKKEIWRKPIFARLIKKRILEVNDIVDEVYLSLYIELMGQPDTPEKLVLWAYSIVDKKLKNLSDKYSMDFKEKVSTEKLNEKEIREMEENLTANADFMPLLQDELEEPDEQFFSPEKFDVQEILEDAGAEQKILNKAELEEWNINIPRLLHQFPEDQQSIFELYYLYRFSAEEIAKIKNINENKIEQLLAEFQKHILQLLPGQEVDQHDMATH